MARARNIKPGFFQHDVIGELPPLARLLFIGLWTISDYKGCIEYRPKRIKTQLLPYDEGVRIEDLVRDLDESGLIAIYTVQGTAYIKLPNFIKHQNPHKNEREAGSDIPDIEDFGAQVVDSKGIAKNREQDGTTPAESLFPLTESLLLNPPSNSCDGASPPTPPASSASPSMAPAKPERRKRERAPSEPAPTAQTWESYAAAYVERYKIAPVRNAMVNGQLSQLVARLGAEDAPHVAAFFVKHRDRFYEQKAHAIGAMLADAEKLRMEWKTGRDASAQSSRVPTPDNFAERDYGALRRI